MTPDSQRYSQPVGDPAVTACRDCDLLQRLPELAPGASARCPRCDKELWRRREDSLNRTLALTVAAAVLYVVANSVPMLGLTIVGREASTTVFGGAMHLWDDGPAMVGSVGALHRRHRAGAADRFDAGDRARGPSDNARRDGWERCCVINRPRGPGA